MQHLSVVHFNLGSSWSMARRGLFRLAPATLLLALSGVMSPCQQSSSLPGVTALAAEYSKLPLSFEANQGQTDPRVRFISRGEGYSLFLTDSSAVLSLSKQSKHLTTADPKHTGTAPKASATSLKSDVIRMELAGASRGLRVAGTDQLAGKVNYFIGNDPAKWRSNVPTYSKVEYSGVYPGIDLIYYGNQTRLEYDFVVAPRADAKPLRLHFAGTSTLTIDSKGDLKVSAKNGEIAFHKPVVYQMKDGKRQAVAGQFKLLANNDLGFALGRYDHNRELVIDPTLAYSTYLGGSTGGESANGIAADTSGHAYVTGETSSTDFPTVAGSYETAKPGNSTFMVPIAFVTKFHQNGSGLVYSTYLGGSGGDAAYAISLDASDDAFITGTTYSSDFPITSGAYESALNAAAGGGFVTKLNSTGSKLVYSTYLNGVGYVTGIAVDGAGHACVTGSTRATDFPVTAGAYQKTNHGAAKDAFNVFVVKLAAAGTGAVYSTYLGGTNCDFAYAIAADAAGHAFVTGTTYSTNFPHSSAAYQTENKAAAHKTNNAFVTEFSESGSDLVYSTYLGGTGAADGVYIGDAAYGIALDGDGDAFVTGTAFSDDFPHTNGAYQIVNNGEDTQASNAFVSKLNPQGTELLYSTYLGGAGVVNDAPLYDDAPVSFGDGASAIALDSQGNAYITGFAVSGNFPVTGDAYQATDPSQDTNEDGDNPVAFFTKLNPQGSSLLYSTFLGGSGCGGGFGATSDGIGDLGNAIAVDPFGNAYLAGISCSSDFPTVNAFHPFNLTAGGSGTGFVSKFGGSEPSKLILVSDDNPAQDGASVTFTAHVEAVSGSGICTGKVFFDINGMESSTVALDGTGHASYSIDSLTAGEQVVDAQYFGDSDCAASNAALTETIVSTTTTSLSSSHPDATSGESVTFTAVVSADDSRDATTGTVTFKNGSATLGTATLKPGLNGTHTVGVATFITTSLPVGTLQITAVYAGSSGFDPSTSPALTEVVTQ